MLEIRTARHSLGLSALVAALAPAVLGQGFVLNPSFESNLNTETDPLAVDAPQGWPYYSQIDDWVSASGGVNDLVYDPGGPFHNAGTPVPDGQRVGFKQGGGTVSQDIYDLVPDERYWIQFHYDARNGSDLDLGVRFSTFAFGGEMDELLDLIVRPRPAIATGSPYYIHTLAFTPDLDAGTLSFEVTARGDSTILLDAVTIVQRDEGNFPVVNPSFEASGVVFDGASTAGTDWPAIGGWAKEGVAGVDDGTGGQANNGRVPDQALVAFIEDEGSLEQTFSPLVTENEYTMEFAYNAKSGTTPHLQVKVDDVVLWEQDVTAVGGASAYRTASVTFTAANDSARIGFANTVAGTVVLLDDVKVLGEVGALLPPLELEPAKLLVRVGEEGTATVTVPDERLAQGPAVIQLASADPDVWVLPDADADGVLSLEFETETTRTFRVQGLSTGSAVVEIIDSAGLLPPGDITTVFVAGTTFVLNPSFDLDPDSGVGTAPVTGWTTGDGNIGMAEAGNAFLSDEDLTIPDRRRVLRIQGGGTVSQMIDGLQPGELYGLQFFYNGRSSGFPYEMSLQVNFAGQELAVFPDVIPAVQDGLADYYFEELRFTPAESSGLLEFNVTVASGDATLFLDAVSILPRLEGEIAVVNSSFEGSAMGATWPGYLQPDRIAGWQASGGGYGVNAYSPKTFFVEPFLDNGINSDQDNAFFGQGTVVISQTVEGLTPSASYTLVLDYNFRDGRDQDSSAEPNTGVLEVSVDGFLDFVSDELPPVDTVSPWPGFRHTKPFYQAFVPVTAFDDYVEIQIAHAGVDGDETLLVDNVRIVPGDRTPPSITDELVDQTIEAGEPVSFNVGASGSDLTYRWFLDGVELADGNGISGAKTATLALAAAGVSDAGTYSVLVSDGLGVVGSTATLEVQGPPAEVTLAISRLEDGNVRIAWPAAAAGFRLQSAAAVEGPYADDPAPVIVEGEENVVIQSPEDAAKFFRLIN